MSDLPPASLLLVLSNGSLKRFRCRPVEGAQERKLKALKAFWIRQKKELPRAAWLGFAEPQSIATLIDLHQPSLAAARRPSSSSSSPLSATVPGEPSAPPCPGWFESAHPHQPCCIACCWGHTTTRSCHSEHPRCPRVEAPEGPSG